MFTLLKKLLKNKPDTKFKNLIEQGAIILDVRTQDEFDHGHVRGSINIPNHELRGNLHRFPNKKILLITCCATGGRSEAAKQTLNAAGYPNIHNGGGWKELSKKLQMPITQSKRS